MAEGFTAIPVNPPDRIVSLMRDKFTDMSKIGDNAVWQVQGWGWMSQLYRLIVACERVEASDESMTNTAHPPKPEPTEAVAELEIRDGIASLGHTLVPIEQLYDGMKLYAQASKPRLSGWRLARRKYANNAE